MVYRTVSKCRVCGNDELVPLLSLGSQALTGVFPKTRDEHVPAVPLELVKCWEGSGRYSCGLVQLRHSADPCQMFGANYGYRSSLNPSMVRHLLGKAAAIRILAGLRSGDIVLDIGSNDGTFLHGMVCPGVRLIGMDPTAGKFAKSYPRDALVVPQTFSAERFRGLVGRKKAKIVTSIAMFYDIEDPLEFVLQIREILAPDGMWVLEQSYLPAMLDSCAYDAICHEHLAYYALKQIVWLADRAGMRVTSVEQNDTNGGSFAVTVVHAGQNGVSSSRVAQMMLREQEIGLDRESVYQEFRARILRHRETLLARLCDGRRRSECILGYGASTKGNVILQFGRIGPKELAVIAEVNPDKFGCFTPGSGIPIVSEAEAKASNPDAFLIFPWHFRAHIIDREREFLRRGGRLIFPLPAVVECSGGRLMASAYSKTEQFL